MNRLRLTMKQLRKKYRVVEFTPWGLKVNGSEFVPYRSVKGWEEFEWVLKRLGLTSGNYNSTR